MAKTTVEKLASASAKLKTVKESLGEADSLSNEQQAELKAARKKLKRAQRSQRTQNTAKTKKDDMEQGRLKNIETVKEKTAKREQAKEAALTAAAQKQVEEESGAEKTSE